MAEEELRKTINEIKETVIRMDTRMSMMASQLDDSVPKLNELEKETERQKDSLKQARTEYTLSMDFRSVYNHRRHYCWCVLQVSTRS